MKYSSWLTAGLVVTSLVAVAACSEDSEDDASAAPANTDCASIAPLGSSADQSFTATSPDFANCMAFPAAATCDGKPFPQGASPTLSWTAGPPGTNSYAVVLKDLSIIQNTPATDPLYNRGYHYMIWDIPATVMSLPAAMPGNHLSTVVPGARQWSNFNDYGYFGPCPNFDPEVPPAAHDSYAFVVYALPAASAPIPAPEAGVSPVRQMDDYFKSVALAIAEHRGTSAAQATLVPEGLLPPMPSPPCPTEGTPPEGCLAGP